MGLLVVLLAVGSPERASAQPLEDVVLVSNLDETISTYKSAQHWDVAQDFTTGSSSGYILTSVELDLEFGGGAKPVFTVAVHASSSGQPGSRLATLTAPTLATGLNKFTHSGLSW